MKSIKFSTKRFVAVTALGVLLIASGAVVAARSAHAISPFPSSFPLG